MKDTRYLTFALCKGRLAKQTLELLEELGITCEEMKDKDSRKLILVNAGCAYADRQMRKNIWRITNLSAWRQNIRILQRIIFIIPDTRR